jgi:polysaccharide biosynthesis/export protein
MSDATDKSVCPTEVSMVVRRCLYVLWGVLAGSLLATSGCAWFHCCDGVQPVHEPARQQFLTQSPIPRELCKTVLPAYTIEPPDILMIDAIHVVPKPPYRLRTLDVLTLQVQGTPPDAPLQGTVAIEPGGFIRLGPSYGSLRIAGMTVEEAQNAIQKHLLAFLKATVVSATLADIGSKQQIAGQHLVGPDGTVTLGSYGSIPVVGMTIAQAKQAVEQHLAQYLEDPEVSLDVYAYNSRVYYVITQGAGLGDGVFKFPITGNETVLDAISQIRGLEQVSSKRIWIARPSDTPAQVQTFPVQWNEITANGAACTNYQILPGDRVFIAEDKLVATDTLLAKIIAPMERVMGFSLLGVGVATRFSGNVLAGGGNPNGNF